MRGGIRLYRVSVLMVIKAALLGVTVAVLLSLRCSMSRAHLKKDEITKVLRPSKFKAREEVLVRMEEVIESLSSMERGEGAGTLPLALVMSGLHGVTRKADGKSRGEVPEVAKLLATGVPSFLEMVNQKRLQMECNIDRNLLDEALPSGKYVVTANLRNSEKIMPNFVVQILKLVNAFPDESVRVSIYESGSKDRTGIWLTFLSKVLGYFGVENVIIANGKLKRQKNQERIDFLAGIRNAALDPVIAWAGQSTSPWNVSHLIFINDVYFCAQSALRLLRNNGDVVCGLDWERSVDPLTESDKVYALGSYAPPSKHIPRSAAGLLVNQKWSPNKAVMNQVEPTRAKMSPPMNFYDKWVAHDNTGKSFDNHMPIVHDKYSLDRIEKGLPFRVHACWNGMVVLKGEPFLSGLRFRTGILDECKGSECMIMCQDFIRLGYDKIIVDPGVRVAYEFMEALDLYTLDHTRIPFVPWADSHAEHPGEGHPQPQIFECCPKPRYAEYADFSRCYRDALWKQNYTMLFLEGAR